jgi:tRNA(fMet)-specific endonuclease VapC
MARRDPNEIKLMLLDTNIISYMFKGDTRAQLYEQHLTGQTLFVSFMTVSELYRWPFEKNWGEQKKQGLVLFLKNFAVLPYDEGLAWTWAELVGRTCRGRQMALQDSWIAATALRHRMPIVTHNRRHFENVPGLTVISEG